MRFLASIVALASLALSAPFGFYDELDYDSIYGDYDNRLYSETYYAFNPSGLFLSCQGNTPTDVYYLDDLSASGTLGFPMLNGNVDLDQMVKVSLNGGGANDPTCDSVLSFASSAPRRLVFLPFANTIATVFVSKTRRLFSLDVSSTSSVTVPANTELCGSVSTRSYFATWSNVNVQASLYDFDGSASPQSQAVSLNSYFDIINQVNPYFCFKNPTSTSQVVANTASQPFLTSTYSSATMGSFTDGRLTRYAFKLPTGTTATTKFYLTIPSLVSVTSTTIRYQYVTDFATVPPSTSVALLNSAAAPVDNTITIDGHGVTSGTVPTHLLIDTTSWATTELYIDSSATSIHSKSITASQQTITLFGSRPVLSPYLNSDRFRNQYSLFTLSPIFAIDLTPFPTNTDLRLIVTGFNGDRFSSSSERIAIVYALSSFVAAGAPDVSAYTEFYMELDSSMASVTFRRNSTQTLLYVRSNVGSSLVPMVGVSTPLVASIESPALRQSISPFIEFNDYVGFYQTTIQSSGLYCYDVDDLAMFVMDAETRKPVPFSMLNLRTEGRLGQSSNVTIGKYTPQRSLYCADVQIDAPALLFLAQGDIYTTPLNYAYENDYYGSYDISSADPTRNLYVYSSYFTSTMIATVYPSQETMILEPLLYQETYGPSDNYYRFTNQLIAALPPSFFAGQTHLWIRSVSEVDLNDPLTPGTYLELFLTQSPIEFFKSSGSADHIELPALVCGQITSYYYNSKARFIWDFELIENAGTSKDAEIDGVYVKFNNYDFDFIEYPDPATSNKYGAKDSASAIDINTYYSDASNAETYLWITYCVQVNGTGSASIRAKSLYLVEKGSDSNIEPFALSEPTLFLPWSDDRFLTVPADEVNPTPSSAAVAVSSLLLLVLGFAL